MEDNEIIVASANPVKIAAVQMAFEQMFPEKTWRVRGEPMPSGVSDQPRTDAETLQGAENRATAAMRAFPNAAFWVGIEGGVQPLGEELLSFAWVVVRGSNGKVGKARSGSFLLPPRVVELVNAGYELGDADDIVFGQSNSKQKMGAVGLLTGGAIDRIALYAHAVMLALIPFGRAWQAAAEH